MLLHSEKDPEVTLFQLIAFFLTLPSMCLYFSCPILFLYWKWNFGSIKNPVSSSSYPSRSVSLRASQKTMSSSRIDLKKWGGWMEFVWRFSLYFLDVVLFGITPDTNIWPLLSSQHCSVVSVLYYREQVCSRKPEVCTEPKAHASCSSINIPKLDNVCIKYLSGYF